MPDYIRIGNGGGFTGVETIFTIFESGKSEQNGKPASKMKKSDVEQLKQNITVLQLDQIVWIQPGNIYKFIEYQINGKNHRITWDSNSEDINPKLNLFYDHAYYLINKSKK